VNGLLALLEGLQESGKLDLQELDEIFMPAVANKGGLISNRLEIDLGPRPAHLSHLLGVGDDRVESLSDLINVEIAH
jgi:hypothetical protein